MSNSAIKIRLTASQLLEIDELHADKTANENTLKIALTFHSNSNSEINKLENSWWQDIANTHGLDLANNTYAIKKIDGSMCIVKVEE